MPLYYFDVYGTRSRHRDTIGDDFESLDEAMFHVQVLLPDILRDDPPTDDHHVVACDLRDETGRVLYRGELTYSGTRFFQQTGS